MLQNMLQLAMSSIDEIESQSGPEVYPAIRRTKDYIRETSLLIQANTAPKPISSENDILFKSHTLKPKGESERTETKSLQQQNSGKDAGIGQLEKVGRLRYIMHLIRKFRRKS
jgi:hypothetical protein